MKKISLLCGIIFIVFNSAAQPAKHVIIISIDGFRPEFYLDPSWPAPNLQQLMKEGLYAQQVRPVFPSVTYPNHVTLITGALPARHAVFANTPFEPEGATGRWNWEAALIKVPTLWDATHQAGMKSASVDWPVSVGAPIDYNIPEIWAADGKSDNTVPLKAATTPVSLWEEVEENATGKILSGDVNSEYLNSDENSGRMAAYIIRTYKPSLTTLHLAATDHAQHGYGREGLEIRKALAAADRVLGEILEAIEKAGIKDSTAILIVGDHGFADVHSTLYPNVWLLQKGLLGKGKDWKVKFQSTSGSAFLHLQTKGDVQTLSAVKKMLDELPLVQKRLFRVIDKTELEKSGADPDAMLALSPIPGIAIGGSSEGEVMKAAMQKGTHGYYPDFPEMMTGFVGWGAGFRQGIVIPQMGEQDIAPIVAKLLGLSFTAPDGILLPGIIK